MSGRFTLTRTPVAGVVVVERQKLGDHRGFLTRLFCAEELAAAGWDKPIAQINHTFTAAKGTIRGMHFQHPPKAEKKLVTCIRGAICDVAADLRHGPASFLKHHCEVLSAENNRALLIRRLRALISRPDGRRKFSFPWPMRRPEGGVSPLDPRLAIPWPLPAGTMSDRDRAHPLLTPEFEGLRL
jgi:dTDP-4-dehydrorhamnose 3,5-epimerase